MSEDEIWYEQGDQSEFDDGYSVWKGREHPDKIAVTDTEGTAEVLCMHAELLASVEAALSYLSELPVTATLAQYEQLYRVSNMLRNALDRARRNV